ncbi:hypothetical protein [Spirulina subsalsa]|nr:hypothetical protein [Spirulina subsalsa]
MKTFFNRSYTLQIGQSIGLASALVIMSLGIISIMTAQSGIF